MILWHPGAMADPPRAAPAPGWPVWPEPTCAPGAGLRAPPPGWPVGPEPSTPPRVDVPAPRSGSPRWALPLGATRVWVTLGMFACLAVAAAVPAWRPADPLSWAPLALVVGTVASTLVHEGAHAWAAHLLGYRVQWIVLGSLVGTTAYEGRDDRPLDQAAVALAGPAASALVVLALLCARLVVPAGVTTAVEVGIALNALAMVLNLLPVGGTDGAVFARAVAQHRRSARLPAHAQPPALAASEG